MKTFSINKSIFAFGIVVLILSGCASSKDFVAENFATIKNTHKKLAILPFEVQFQNPLDYSKRQKGNAIQARHSYSKQEQEASLDAQKEFFIAVAKQVEKGRYEVAFQDFTRTNKVLAENGIRIEDVKYQNKADLAKLLGVDAIIFGELIIKISRPTDRTMSISPVMMENTRFNDGVETEVKLFDATSGEMLWSTVLSNQPNNRMDTPHQLSTSLLSQVAKNLPYRTK
jgi:PBP1b-binding outer membrane lipoprotein LpoB